MFLFNVEDINVLGKVSNILLRYNFYLQEDVAIYIVSKHFHRYTCIDALIDIQAYLKIVKLSKSSEN